MLNKINSKRLLLLVSTATILFAAGQINADTQFIKYKNYLIPINSETCEKPKVIVSTDYGAVAATDPNEPQDLVHYLAYSNHFDTRAIIASTSPGTGNKAYIEDAIDLYEDDYSTYFLNSSNGDDYPDPAGPSDLKNILFNGVAKQTTTVPINSNASTNKIISEAANASVNCPLNILVWGAMTDVASAVRYMPVEDRGNLRIIAIGSTNRSQPGTSQVGDPKAWAYVENIGSSIPSENFIPMDVAFRSLFLGATCGVNRTLINDNGAFGRTEDIMNDLTDNVSSGLRGLVQSTRGQYSSNENLANRANCPASSSSSANTLRLADSLTTMYLLDEVMGFDGELKDIIEADDQSTSGIKNPAVLRKIYDHYRNRMNDIY